MSTKRIVVVADQHNLGTVCKALLQAGVKAKEIYVSKDQGTTTLEKMGVNINLPAGQIQIKAHDGTRPSEMDDPIP